MDIPANFDGFVYCYGVEGPVNGQEIKRVEAALVEETKRTDEVVGVEASNEIIRFTCSSDQEFRVLVICGEPLRENPIAQHGPFVMTTLEEFIKAFKDDDRETLAQQTDVPMT